MQKRYDSSDSDTSTPPYQSPSHSDDSEATKEHRRRNKELWQNQKWSGKREHNARFKDPDDSPDDHE